MHFDCDSFHGHLLSFVVLVITIMETSCAHINNVNEQLESNAYVVV
jgi:hypothetical protein